MLKTSSFAVVLILVLGLAGCWSSPLTNDIAIERTCDGFLFVTAVCPGETLVTVVVTVKKTILLTEIHEDGSGDAATLAIVDLGTLRDIIGDANLDFQME